MKLNCIGSYSEILNIVAVSKGLSREISCFSSTTHTEFLIVLNTVIEAFGKHSRPLAVSLHKLHSAFLQLCYVNSAPARTLFLPFSGWETGYFPAMAYHLTLVTLKLSHIKLQDELSACWLDAVCTLDCGRIKTVWLCSSVVPHIVLQATPFTCETKPHADSQICTENLSGESLAMWD